MLRKGRLGDGIKKNKSLTVSRCERRKKHCHYDFSEHNSYSHYLFYNKKIK